MSYIYNKQSKTHHFRALKSFVVHIDWVGDDEHTH